MDSTSFQLTGKIIMVIAIVVLFFIFAFLLFLQLYAKWFWYNQPPPQPSTTPLPRRRRRHGLDFAESAAATILRRGLDPSVLKSLPILIFDPKDFKDGLECSVCLSELADGEKTRLLPNCNHGFHVDCIDMWFQSHSTCPLCRNPVSNQSQESLAVEDVHNSESYSTETPNFPTNVLYWGNETQVSTLVGPCLEENNNSTTALETVSPNPCCSSSSSSSMTSGRDEGMLVIDIPRQVVEEEESKSPVTTRLRSLKRLLSRDRRFNPFSASVDSEQANRAQV